MSAVLVASIRDLCTEDHGDRSEMIARWTANKTPDGVAAMMAHPGAVLFAALLDGTIAGVGAINGDATIGLNYVAPKCRFVGVSKALLAHLEEFLRARGAREAELVSTATAYRFYRAAGWTDAGEPETMFGLTGFPMRKLL